MKLSQFVATLKSVKNAAHTQVTGTYHALQRTNGFVGRVRTYQGNDDGDIRPDEVEIVQTRAPELLQETSDVWAKLFDFQAGVDFGNTVAKANVVVGGQTLIADAPVPFLLFLEKQLKDWIALVKKIPQLDPSKAWFWDSNREEFFTEGIVVNATLKKEVSDVVVQATERFPAQVRDRTQDVVVGRWTTVHRSGAMHRKDIRALLARAEELAEAVKIAREEANTTEVTSKRGTGKVVFDYLLNRNQEVRGEG